MKAYHLGFLCLFLLLSGCSFLPSKPKTPENLCSVFAENEDWYEAAERSFQRSGTPIHVQMAIMYHESAFTADARPPRHYYLGFIPGPRPSTAYGYAQALDGTWEWYQNDTQNNGADRDDFEDAIDFVGWYCKKTHEINKISKWDAENQYLAYYVGHKGYTQKNHRSLPWLLKTAKRVAARARKYHQQLKTCKAISHGK